MLKIFIFISGFIIPFVTLAHNSHTQEGKNVAYLLESEFEDLLNDYEIQIIEDETELYQWTQELIELEALDENPTEEEIVIFNSLSEWLPEWRFIPVAVKAMKRTCSALQASGASEGEASWYGGKFHGRRTANGERYNQNEMTAAHKTLPFNSIIEVTYRGRSVRVRINDAGPYHGNRIIDLSRAAADQLGLKSRGVGQVKLRLISCGKK